MEVQIGRIGSLSHCLQSFFSYDPGGGRRIFEPSKSRSKMYNNKSGGVLFILSLGKSMEIRVVLWPQKLTNMWVNKSERC